MEAETKRRLRLGRAVIKELGKINSKDVSLETKTGIIHTLIFPIAMYVCKNWLVKKVGSKKKIDFIWNMVLEESSTNTLDCQKHEQVGPRAT